MKLTDLKLADEFKAGLEYMKYIAQSLNGTGARVYPMDIQGTVDLAHLVYGDNYFYDLYDDGEFIDHLMNLCVEAINLSLKVCLDIIPESEKTVVHYCETIMPRELGGIKTSEDTSTLLSKKHVEYIAMSSARGINFGNSEMQNIEYVLKRCSDSGKILYSSVNKDKNEPWNKYFTRLLKASYKDDKFHLLLSLSC